MSIFSGLDDYMNGSAIQKKNLEVIGSRFRAQRRDQGL